MNATRWIRFIVLFSVIVMVQIAFLAREYLSPDNLDPITFVVCAVCSVLGTACGIGLVIWILWRRSKKANV